MLTRHHLKGGHRRLANVENKEKQVIIRKIFVIKHLSSTSMYKAFSKQSWLCTVRATEVIFVEEIEVQSRNVNNGNYASLLYMLFPLLRMLFHTCPSIKFLFIWKNQYICLLLHENGKQIMAIIISSSVSHTLKTTRIKTQALSTSVLLNLAHSKCSVSTE